MAYSKLESIRLPSTETGVPSKMAAPLSITLQNLPGKIRKVATAVSMHPTITQPSSNKFKMAQSVTANKFPSTTEDYTLDRE